ncbi:MAG TPA: methyltransferase domain-containing protein [Candidatus Limnocylindrales bacterium]|nr:methyltransferase domain-containing protein [Candidatus Limnocylindrales bacterium]
MERLAHAEELLDGPLDDLDAVAGNLRDLRRFNRVFGLGLSRAAIERLAPGRDPLRLIDIGTGGADIPVALLADAARAGRELCVTAVDQSTEILATAERARPGLGSVRNLDLVVAEASSLPYPDDAFDVAHSSLVAHHLEPDEVIAMLRESARVARRGVVLNDLVRGRLFWAAAWVLGRTMTRNPLTRVDAPMSVRRAYIRAELRELVSEAGLRIEEEYGGLFGHRVAIAAVRR